MGGTGALETSQLSESVGASFKGKKSGWASPLRVEGCDQKIMRQRAG
jgi:hypothetical protein